MGIKVSCKCGYSYEVKDQFAGQESNCPYCGKPVHIPEAEKMEEKPVNPPPVSLPTPTEQETVEPMITEKIEPKVSSVPEQQQAKFAGSEDKEICANCGKELARSERAYVLDGKIVCVACESKLSGDSPRGKVVKTKKKLSGAGMALVALGSCMLVVGFVLNGAPSLLRAAASNQPFAPPPTGEQIANAEKFANLGAIMAVFGAGINILAISLFRVPTAVPTAASVTAHVRTSGLAVGSLALGIPSFFMFGLTAIPGLILGILALKKIRRNAGILKGRGLAIAGIVTSSIGCVLNLMIILAVLS